MAQGLGIFVLVTMTIVGSEARCGERLERALDMMQQRGNSARRRFDAEEPDAVYHQRLHSAPIDISISKMLVEIPGSSSGGGGSREGHSWAKVERCSYEPKSNSIRTRVGFNELSVTGLVRLSGREARARIGLLPAESCRMSLRLRRAGIDFYTSPIARGRGQMRIRTESSFLEPRFASIYAYGCRPAAFSLPTSVHYDRVESEPRKREIANSLIDSLGINQSNSVLNSTSLEEEEVVVAAAADEENRLAASVIDAQASGTSNDLLLDTLWRSRADIAREMEDVFLRSASQAVTHYIEKQLHPAIKETLMLSMGYTISYG